MLLLEGKTHTNKWITKQIRQLMDDWEARRDEIVRYKEARAYEESLKADPLGRIAKALSRLSNISAAIVGNALHLGFNHTNYEIIGLIRKLGAKLAGLGSVEGAQLTMITADIYDRERVSGNHRYEGEIVDGCLRIQKSYPRISATILNQALELTGQYDDERAEITVKNRVEFKALVSDGPSKVFDLSFLAPQLTLDGLVGKLKPQDARYGVVKYLFTMRFQRAWEHLGFSEMNE